jgi:hypothetical protein
MDPAVANLVRDRAGERCEYCRLHQGDAPFFRFHIEHVIPKQHGGGDDPMNLALACQHCNLHKGTNLAGIDPENGQIVPLFNPRSDQWDAHFERRGIRVAGLTPAGRATVEVLQMNAAPRLELRAELLSGGRLE